MHISGLYVDNFLSYDRVQISFKDSNVIVGGNNSGKTNLVRVLMLLNDPITLLIINDVKNVGTQVMHSGYGALKIGSNVWNPIAGAVWTTPTGALIDMNVFSYVDRYPGFQ